MEGRGKSRESLIARLRICMKDRLPEVYLSRTLQFVVSRHSRAMHFHHPPRALLGKLRNILRRQNSGMESVVKPGSGFLVGRSRLSLGSKKLPVLELRLLQPLTLENRFWLSLPSAICSCCWVHYFWKLERKCSLV